MHVRARLRRQTAYTPYALKTAYTVGGPKGLSPHDETTHHFRLFADGGVIEVTANELKDTDSRDQIRMHLSHIARMFTEGNFQAPMLIHDRVPPVVPALQTIEIPGGLRLRRNRRRRQSAHHDQE